MSHKIKVCFLPIELKIGFYFSKLSTLFKDCIRSIKIFNINEFSSNNFSCKLKDILKHQKLKLGFPPNEHCLKKSERSHVLLSSCGCFYNKKNWAWASSITCR